MLLPTGFLWSQPAQAALGIDPLTDAEQILSFADTAQACVPSASGHTG
jgi:hypothetical protein